MNFSNTNELLQHIIETVVKEGITVELSWSKDHNCISYKVGGFYKSGSAELVVINDSINAFTRYDNVNIISNMEDLVDLNCEWKSMSCEKTWPDYDHNWKNLLLRYDAIELDDEDFEKVIFNGATKEQISWGGNDDPNLVLEIGAIYNLEEVEVHSSHTKYKLKGIKGWFNSVSFTPYLD